ncbi:MAG: class I SAM-dependent methyltransferase [Christensenellales bacterium]
MAFTPGLGGTFNTVCEQYDRWRPTYVPELYRDIFAAMPVGPGSRALEVGIGTGQATLPILQTGCAVTAVELGDQLAAFCRDKFAHYPGFEVVNQPFEAYEGPEGGFDLGYSASAFHWVPAPIGYPKMLRLLKPGGVFARFSNRPYRDKAREDLHQAMQAVYARYMPGVPEGAEHTEADTRAWARLAEQYGFVDTSWHLYRRTRTFTAAEYICLLGTYSDHIAIEAQTRGRFFAELEGVIEDFGGRITLFDTLGLALARKPG